MLSDYQFDYKSPPVILFLLDQSGSMNEKMEGGRSRSEAVCDALNNTLDVIIKKCCRQTKIAISAYVGVIGYGGRGARNLLPYSDEGVFCSCAKLALTPWKIEERKKRMQGAAGEVTEKIVRFQHWVEPASYGGTPFCQAAFMAIKEIGALCRRYSALGNVLIFNITDGEATDGDPEQLARMLASLAAGSRQILFYNLHLGDNPGTQLTFPQAEDDAAIEFARKLFRMTSPLPLHMLHVNAGQMYKPGREPRGLIMEANDFEKISIFFDIIREWPVKQI